MYWAKQVTKCLQLAEYCHASSPRIQSKDTGDDVNAIGRDDGNHHLRKDRRAEILYGLHGAQHSADQHTKMSGGILRDSLGCQDCEEVDGRFVLPG